MTKKKKRFSLGNIILVLILLMGMALLLYPSFSDYWNSFHQSRAIMTYMESVSQMETSAYDAIMASAREYNEKLDTGRVELVVESLTLLGKCKNMLPFDVSDSRSTREDVRLKYRYLDLRSQRLHNNIVLRSHVIRTMRRCMEEKDFLEIQTPILTASSPEGARDFLVPSRKHKGKFYALPQAPQQFKQLLMVSGFDRYFQIAPCFRDEDARQDRSPGEFYQLDFEMAFATQEDVLQVCEDVIYDVFKTYSTKKISDKPFRRITFKDAMMQFGTDKPDLRNPLRIFDLTDFFAKVDFPLFKGKPVRGIVADCFGQSRKFFEDSLKFATSIGMKGLGYLTLTDGEFKGPIAKFLTPEQKEEITALSGIRANETLFFICDAPSIVNREAGEIRTWLGENLGIIDQDSYEFCYVVDFPMYEIDPSTGKTVFTHNPFSMPQGGLEALETKAPTEVLAYQYDLVCNGIELASGAVRNHDVEIMRKAFAIAGYTEDEAIPRKNWNPASPRFIPPSSTALRLTQAWLPVWTESSCCLPTRNPSVTSSPSRSTATRRIFSLALPAR